MLPFIFIIPLLFGLISDSSWQTTFCDIRLVNSLNILHCDRIQDTLTFEAGTNIAITLTNATDTIKISSTGGKAPNQLYCDVGKWFNAFNGTTSNFRCETVPSGGSGQDTNTAQIVSAGGTTLFKQRDNGKSVV